MEIKTTENIFDEREFKEVYENNCDGTLTEFGMKRWVSVDDLKKRLFDSDIPIKYSQKIIDELGDEDG